MNEQQTKRLHVLAEREMDMRKLDCIRAIERKVNAAFAEPGVTTGDDNIGEELEEIHRRLIILSKE